MSRGLARTSTNCVVTNIRNAEQQQQQQQHAVFSANLQRNSEGLVPLTE